MPLNANKINIVAGLFRAFAYESLDIGVSSTALTSAIYTSSGEKAKRAIITTETASIRYRYDGTAPTATEGHLLTPQSVLILIGSDNITNFRAIRSGSTSGVIRCTYEN